MSLNNYLNWIQILTEITDHSYIYEFLSFLHICIYVFIKTENIEPFNKIMEEK